MKHRRLNELLPLVFYSTSKDCTFIDELPPRRGRSTEDRRGRQLALSKQAKTDHNVYFCVDTPELGLQMLEKQRRDGVDTHSLANDPLFVDVANGDFQLKPDSPARAIGIVPLDLSKVGLVDD